MAGKHAVSTVGQKVEPLPVKAAVKGVGLAEKATGRHRAGGVVATGRHRASGQVDMRGKSPASTSPAGEGSKSPIPLGPANPLRNYNKRLQGGGAKPAKYKGKSSLTGPPASRTRYIRYLGKDDRNNTGKLIAEWLLGVILICVAVPIQAANAGYLKTITSIMYRLTALTAVFFVLALMSDTKGAKTAVYAGLLIDLGIIFNAVQVGTFKGITNIMTGNSTLIGTAQPASDITKASPIVAGGGLFDPSGENAGGGGTPAGGGNNPVPA